MRTERFDDIIKKKLDSIEVDNSRMNWSTMKARMEENAFDEKIIEQIEQSNPVIPPMNWDMMKSKIDQDFDEKVSHLVEKANPTLQNNHWALLRNKLLERKETKENIAKLKLIESVLVILLLLIIFNFGKFSNYDGFKGATQNIFTEEYKKNTEKLPFEMESEVSYSDMKNGYSKKSKMAVIEKVTKFKNRISAQSELQNTNYTGRLSNSKQDVSQPEKTNSRKLNLDKIRINKYLILPKTKIRTTAITLPNDEIEIDSIGNYITLLDPIDSGFSIKTSKVKDRNYYMSVSAGVSKNIIRSPYDKYYRVGAKQVFGENTRLSILVNKEIRRFELYTGFRYGIIEYSPTSIKEILASSTSTVSLEALSLDKIHFETFALPIGAKYNLKTGRHNFFVNADITSNIVSTTWYTINQYSYSNNTFESSKSLYRVPENSILQQKNFQKGLLGGGAARDNLYFTAGFGGGYRYKLSPYFSLFTQVQYNHDFSSNGLGPNNDKIHSVSADFGVYFRL